MTIKICQNCGKPIPSDSTQPYCDNIICQRSRILGADPMHSKFGEMSILKSSQWFEQEIPEREYCLYPILPKSSITLVAGQKGCGKTWFCMSLVDALTKRENFGVWENRTSRELKVLYLDAEMHPSDTNQRLRQLDTNDNLFIYSSANNYEKAGIRSDLSLQDFRDALTVHIAEEQFDFLVLDNLASLTPSINENLKSDWDPINQWLLQLRAYNITILLVHHLGKSGEQRGTSAREDNVDLIIYLKKPRGYSPDEGARFILSFDKFRGKVDPEYMHTLKKREMWYKPDDHGNWNWNEIRDLSVISPDLLKDFVESGLSQAALAQKYNMGQATISRRRRLYIDEGYLEEEEDGTLLFTEKTNEFLEQEYSVTENESS